MPCASRSVSDTAAYPKTKELDLICNLIITIKLKLKNSRKLEDKHAVCNIFRTLKHTKNRECFVFSTLAYGFLSFHGIG